MFNKFKKYKRPLSFIWESFKGNKKMFYIFFVWKILEWIFYVIFPVLAKLEMDQLVEKNTNLFWIIELNSFNIFLIILFIIFSLKLIENFLNSFIEIFEYDYVKIYDILFLKSLYKRLENIDPWILLNKKNNKFISDIIWWWVNVWNFVRQFLWKIISNIFVIIWITTVLALINIWIFIVIIISSILIYYIEKIKEKIKEKNDFESSYDYQEKIRILNEQMSTNFTYLMTSWGFSFVLDNYNKYNNILREKFKTVQKQNLLLNILSFVIENISEILVKLIVWFGIFFTTTSIWTLTLILLYISRINDFMYFIRSFKFEYNHFSDNLLKLDLFLDLTEISKNKNLFKEDINKLEFKNVSFNYPNFAEKELKYIEIIENRLKSYSWKMSDYEKDQLHIIQEAKKDIQIKPPTILNNINIVFEKWKTYWLVWKNWAWKTTLTSLILNYFDDYKWNILIDSEELKNFKREFFMNNISVINQLPYIIEWFTIRENLLLWVNIKYSDDYILWLLDKFWLKKKVLKNRKWLDSKIWYENDFSWWEKQLLVVIRIILQDKKILIMDEWTNQLDAENELKVMNELLKNKKDKIIIFITHKMTTIKKADTIYCLENGSISNIWTHNQLLNYDNIYNNFWKKQVWN